MHRLRLMRLQVRRLVGRLLARYRRNRQATGSLGALGFKPHSGYGLPVRSVILPCRCSFLFADILHSRSLCPFAGDDTNFRERILFDLFQRYFDGFVQKGLTYIISVYRQIQDFVPFPYRGSATRLYEYFMELVLLQVPPPP